MKTLTLLLVLFTSILQAQTIRIETGSNAGDMHQFAITAGFLSPINGSTFTGGVVHKRYIGGQRTGIRLDVQIPIGNFAHFYTLADSFYDHASAVIYNGTFLEIGAGVGLHFKGISLNAGYQMSDYNPNTNIEREDKFLIRLGYNINL